ncbi:MAG TPA: nitroreductase family protein [bacterium]|nr:nitroreductase family protein [bacterium]
MDALEAIARRRSVRSYDGRPVGRDMLEKIVAAGMQAATARNVQPWEFVAVTERETLRRIAAAAEYGKFIAEAGACIAVYCADTKYYLEDGCAATQNILVAAAALGVGSCWVAGDKKEYCPAVSALLGTPQGCRLISLIALGYPRPAGESGGVRKRAVREALHWERF